MFSKFSKAYQIGFSATLSLFNHRIRSYQRIQKLRGLAKKNKAHHSWDYIKKLHSLDIEFVDFFQNLQHTTIPFLHNIFNDELLQPANSYSNVEFKIFDNYIAAQSEIPWLKDSKYNFVFKSDFYKNIQIRTYHTKELGPDIKYPWELSRCLHLPLIGYAYEQTKQQHYIDVFIYHIQDWLERNPYLMSVNWVCPMDVAIRALNWVVAFQFFKKTAISQEFWQLFVSSLYDHMLYLEHNWEIYDTRTSNHYLSDLVGYFYLTYYFKTLSGIEKKHDWCFQEIIKEFDKQIFFEGTDYEGSTRYHRLVTELFSLFYFLAKHEERVFSVQFEQKYERMIDFITWCTPVHGDLLQIGDNDSGRIIEQFSEYLIKQQHKELIGTKHFEQFGLSVIKTQRVHLSLRHHSYEHKQPSGHFHNDVASVTFALDGKQVLVDPGSFVYTPSSIWRNIFRSVDMHNTSYIVGQEPVALTPDLFYLNIPSNVFRISGKDSWLLQTSHYLYQKLNLIFHRSIKLDQDEHTLTIIDWWESAGYDTQEHIKMGWNFTFSPEITLIRADDLWHLYHQDKIIGVFKSTIAFEQRESWFSSGYSQKQTTNCLRAQSDILNEVVVTTIEYE